jgi:hypothetical protein
MTWKSYAVVSGATVLAGWLASTPPANAPATSTLAPSQPSSRRAAPSSDIEQEAARLKARVRRETGYTQPQRNLFRFGAARRIASAEVNIPEAASPADTFVPAVLPPAPVSLSGIAEDQVDQRVERTAILSSPAGVLLVREGDDVLGQYRVAKIESEAVELVQLADGTTLRLGFKP